MRRVTSSVRRMRILIYGGTGYIGSKLAEYLVEHGHDIGNVSRRKLEIENVDSFSITEDSNSIIDKFKPDKVIYLSACFDNNDIEGIVDINVAKPLEVLQCLESLKNIEFIYIGTYWQFGDSNAPNIPIDLYSASKKAMVSFLDYYNQYTELSCKEVVLYGTYGESDERGKLLDYLLDSVTNNKAVNLTEGNQLLNLVHVDDVCKKIISTLSDTTNKKFQILSNKNYTPRGLVNIINTLKEIDVNFGVIPYRKVELMTPVLDMSYQTVYVEDSIRQYIFDRVKGENEISIKS